jgi:uncharacterized membrane protein YfcA
MIELSLSSLGILFAAAILAGFVDAIAGGGGIITVPALLAVGFPPHLALGTNKLQASFGSLTATLNYRRGNMLRFRELAFGITFTALGACAGTMTVQLISVDALKYIIPVLLLIIFVYVLCNPKLGDTHRPHRMVPWLFYLVFGCAIGFYDGFFGPGTGFVRGFFLTVVAITIAKLLWETYH